MPVFILWLMQASSSFPELSWQIVLWLLGAMSFVLGLLGALATMVYKRDWQLLTERFERAEERRVALAEKVSSLERRVGDLEP